MSDHSHPLSRAVLPAIVFFSLVMGAVCVWQFGKSPSSIYPVVDEDEHLEWAGRIMEDPLGGKVFYQDPLYPYFLAMIFVPFGKSLLLVRCLQVLMGAAAVLFTARAAARMAGKRAAWIAAGAMALYGGMYFYELLILKETMAIMFSALALDLGLLAAQRPGDRGTWLGFGLVMGTLCLLRGNFLLLLPLTAGWALFMEGRPGRNATIRAAVFCAGALIIIGPVTARNYIVSGELVVTTAQGGTNFYIGNNPDATGRFMNPPFARPHPRFLAEDFKAEAERYFGRKITYSQSSRYWFEKGLEWIKFHPWEAMHLLKVKARLLVHQFEIADIHDFYLTRSYFVPALYDSPVGFGIVWGPALIGLIVFARRGKAWVFPLGFVVVYAASLLPFFVVSRYRVPLYPALAAGLAPFAVLVYRLFQEKRRLALALVAAVCLGFWALGLLPIPESREPVYVYNLALSYMETGKSAAALPLIDKGLAETPGDEPLINLWSDAIGRMTADDVPALVKESTRPGITAREQYLIAERLFKLEAYEDSRRVCKAILAEMPDHRLALELLSKIDKAQSGGK